MIAPLYKGKRERNECGNYRGISLLNVVGKIGMFVGCQCSMPNLQLKGIKG